MSKETEMKIAMAVHKIAMTVSDEDLSKIGQYLKDIEDAVLEDGRAHEDRID